MLSLFKPKCSQCRNVIPDSEVPKWVKFASGSYLKCCKRCYEVLGRPDNILNALNSPTKRQMGLW